jgi:ATP-binding cassette subfamily B protein
MVFHHGELRELGTHNELLLNRGLYWRLYQLQYSDEKLHLPPEELSPMNLSLKSGK